MEITTTEEVLVKNLVKYFTTDLSENLDKSGLDKEEKDANLVLSRKKIAADAEGIASVVFKSFWVIMSDQNERDVRPWDLFNGSPRSTEDIAKSRLEICKTCDFLDQEHKHARSVDVLWLLSLCCKMLSVLLGNGSLTSPKNYSGLWSDSDLQEHPLQQVSEKTFIAREDDSLSNRGLSLSRLFSMAIGIFYHIPWKSEKF